MSLIRLENIKKKYHEGEENELEVLHGVGLNIEEGEFVSIVGESGSGKSTLMNIIGLLDRPNSGSYFLNGQDVSETTDNERSRIRNQQIGFVFQTYNLIPRTTAVSNVEVPMMYAGVPKRERTERAQWLLERVGMKERMQHRPEELSGGQKQRVAIARAMANSPAILLADEPPYHRSHHPFSAVIRGDPEDPHINGWQDHRGQKGQLCFWKTLVWHWPVYNPISYVPC